VPLRPSIHLDISEARPVQYVRPVDTHPAGQPGIPWSLRLPIGQHQPSARPQDTASLNRGHGRIGREVERVDAYTFGRVAATNALSVIYAMGGEPLVAVNLLGWPAASSPASWRRRSCAAAWTWAVRRIAM
jgi:AIR synthase related protein